MNEAFRRAARVLERTQPAVSQAIRRLEARDRRNVVRPLVQGRHADLRGRGAGRLCASNAESAARGEQRDQGIRGLHKGKVTICANEHTVFCLLPVIEEFRSRHPHIKIEVQRGVASRIPKEITAREVELGVISFKPSDESLRSVPILTDELLLIVAPAHPLAGRRSVRSRSLGDETFVAHNALSPYRQKVIETFEKNNTTLNIAVELPSLEAIKKLVETGVGVALIPKLTAKTEIAAGQLVGLSVTEMKLERKLNIIYRRNSVLSHAAEAFLKIAKEMKQR